MKKLILTAAIFFSLVGALSAGDEQPLDPNKLFYNANSLYEKREYEKALEEYKKILDMGIDSGCLYYNMGNSYFKMGKLGYAILYYEKAKRIMPQDNDLKSNLSYAKSLVGTSTVDIPRRNPVVTLVKTPFKDFSMNAIAICALIFYLIFIALQIAFIINPVLAKKLRLIYVVILIFFIVNLGALAIRYYDEAMQRRGVVIQRDVDCRYEPIDRSTTFYKLQEGDRVSILKTRDGWRQIKRIDGKAGWVRQEAVEEI